MESLDFFVTIMRRTSNRPHRQRGLSLLYAMLALAALALASIGLMRAISTSSMVAGNLSFQQEATLAADQAVRQAIAALTARLSTGSGVLDNNQLDIGYYASTDELLDVTGSQLTASNRKLINWSASYCGEQVSGSYASCAFTPITLGNKINGNTASYIIFRLCASTGSATDKAGTGEYSLNCARSLRESNVSATNEIRDYSTGSGTSANFVSPYYRIVVRVSGARNTTSYTETIVHF